MAGDAPFPAPPQHRALTEDEQKALVQEAFDTSRAIKAGTRAVAKEMWALAEHVYRFHEGGHWGLLGLETLEEFLADPEVTMKRTQFFRLSKMWRDLVVTRQIPRETLEELDQSKVAEVVPAIMRGEVKVDDALADVKVLGARDLRIKYKGEEEPDPSRNGDAPAESKVSAAGEQAPDVDLPESELKDEGTVAAERLVAALDASEHVAFRRSWPKLSNEERIENAKAWLEAVVA